MARYTGPVYKIARRLNYSILETGEELKKRPYPPGQHGKRRRKLSQYGLQLQEKQRVRFNYGLTEKQLKRTFLRAKKLKGKIGENFLILLEKRLDNFVYRAGFASTKRQARQLVNHGHILVDGKKVDIPSFTISVGQTIEPNEKAKELKIVNESLATVLSTHAYVGLDKDNKKATLLKEPERQEFLRDINEQLIVEFYNK